MSSHKFNVQTNISLRERVTIDIRNAILTGQLQPGQRIKEQDISEQMGVSRGPVREAIRQLEREGLLISQPYRETVVADISIEEVKDVLIPIRFHLEWFVIRKYVAKMDEQFYDKLQDIVNQMTINLKEDNFEQLVDQDILFHETIIQFADEHIVELTWRSILNQIKLHFIKNIQYFDKNSLRNDHQTLLDKLKSKDLEMIQKELIRHLKGDESFLCFIDS